MNELDVVKLIKDFKNIKKGTLGTIVHKYDKHNFEVEFIDDNKETIDIYTIDDSYLECVWKFKES